MTEPTKSPLAPDAFPDMPALAGMRLAVGEAGIKYQGRADVLLAAFDEGTQIAGVFTQSTMPGPCIPWCRDAIARTGGRVRGLVVKAGNANVFTAEHGVEACRAIAQTAADKFGCTTDEIMLSATGVIGELLPYEKVTDILPALEPVEDGWAGAAMAIMTTDTFPKGATATAMIGETKVTINGIAKGSGMIEPDMATMLAYIATDAALSHGVLDALLREAVQPSFNAITVDSDTSTSDTVLLIATGKAGNAEINGPEDARLENFRANLNALMVDLAQQIVRDGEGASKFIIVQVTGAETDDEAMIAAKSIANSPLVKTAIAGEDANWGRVVMAVGKAGVKGDQQNLQVTFGGQPVTEAGRVRDGYDEAMLDAHLKGHEIDLAIDLGVGDGAATVWTCDLTHGYITINADYRS